MAELVRYRVIPGVEWVEIPGVGLRILCGCPEDVVKHLMQRGLVREVKRGPVAFETGPNAILLSDVLLQQGYFSNLAEFPVLQMLYRQGMLIPNHPNNTGVKPLLIGTSGQLAAQLAYIYRGNYGLVTPEELVAAGATPARANELFRMKLKFAFGRIRPTTDLVDTLTLDHNQREEIRGGLAIRRVRQNVFEFEFRGETLMVDLNLAEKQRYHSPFPLSFHEPGRDYFSVIHSGQGDGWDINRTSMGSILIFQGRIYLVDAGPNLQYVLTALGIGNNEIEGIFHTHCHDDHFSGLTTLIRSDRRVKYFAIPLVRHAVFKKLAALMTLDEQQFEELFEVHDLTEEVWNDIEGLEVRPVLSPHPVETSILFFRTHWNDRIFTYAHLADIISLGVLASMVTEDANVPGITKAMERSVRSAYLEPVDVKKIDIGGGMIHGLSKDFADDRSQRIVLAHTSAPLALQDKVIGSSAPFGVVDILIPDRMGLRYLLRAGHLQRYFRQAPLHELNRLLNNEVVRFNPGAIILGHGTVPEHLYLLFSGIVEQLHPVHVTASNHSSGALIGEYGALHGLPVGDTYRAISHVEALPINAAAFQAFVRNNRYYTEIERLHENTQFLGSVWLFGEMISPQVRVRLARSMKLQNIYSAKPKSLDKLKSTAIYLVKSGRVDCLDGDDHHRAIGPGEFFGEEHALKFGKVRSYQTAEPTSLYEIPVDEVRSIPIVMLKLLEIHRKRVQTEEAERLTQTLRSAQFQSAVTQVYTGDR